MIATPTGPRGPRIKTRLYPVLLTRIPPLWAGVVGAAFIVFTLYFVFAVSLAQGNPYAHRYAVHARFVNAEYDELYRQSKRIPDGPERTAIYRKMATIVAAYNPWDLGVYRYENTLVRPWVQGYKKNIYIEHPWHFIDIDVAKRKTK